MSASPATSLLSAVMVGSLLLSQVSSASGLTITATEDPPGAYSSQGFTETGSRVKLTCGPPSGSKALTWTYLADPANKWKSDPVAVLTNPAVTLDGESISFSGVTGKVGGKYICSDGINTAEHWLQVLDADSIVPRDAIKNGTQDKLSVGCYQRFKEPFPLIWSKTLWANDTNHLIDGGDPDNFKLEGKDADYDLTIRHKDRKRFPLKTGQYICQLNLTDSAVAGFSGASKLNQKVQYSAKPDVTIDGATAGKSKSATKDEVFSLTCRLSTENKGAYLAWFYKNNGTYEKLADSHIFDLPSTCPSEIDAKKRCVVVPKFENGTFIFSKNEAVNASVELDPQTDRTFVLEFLSIRDLDKGSYMCEAYEDDGLKRPQLLNVAEVEIKVKDKLAALWPFLGIVAEVVVLCAIIFIYEKRRNKTVDEEDENEPMKGEVRETKEVTIRSRK